MPKGAEKEIEDILLTRSAKADQTLHSPRFTRRGG